MTPEQMSEERERLLLAHAEITEVLRRHRLVAYAAVAGQFGRFEAIGHFEAPWFKAQFLLSESGEPVGLHLVSKAADYAGDVQRKREELESTLGAVLGIGEMLGHVAMMLLAVSREVDAATGAEHTPLRRDDETPGFQ